MRKIHCDGSARTSNPGAFSLASAIIANDRTRTCRTCGFIGPEPLFKKNGNSHGNVCKRCDSTRHAKYARQNREAINAKRRARYHLNTEANRRRARERAHSARGREINRAAVARYKENHPEKTFARRQVARALKRGTIVKPKTCQVEGCRCTGPLHGHHPDYSNPLKVDWLCREHHERVHHTSKRLRLKASADRKFTRAPDFKAMPTAIAA